MSRWEVFKQDAQDKPHQAVGSVHAADAQHALVTAAHVFARRPSAYSLWVAQASDIYSRTAQELAAEAQQLSGATGASSLGEASAAEVPAVVPAENPARVSFEAFRKSSHRRSMTFVDHVATFEASTPAAALVLAIAATEAGASRALAWWVVPTAAITASAPSDSASWFDPAKDKTYKQQALYGAGPSKAARREA